MVRGDAEDMAEEKVEKLKKKKKEREEEREKALKDGQQVKMRNSSKKEGIERMLKCASRDAEKAATGNDLNGEVRGKKKRRKEAAVSLQEEECDLTLGNVEETDKGKCKESEKSSQTSAEEAVLEKKRKTEKLKHINEFEEGGGGGMKMRAGVLGDGGSEEGKAERQKKIKKAKTAGEGLPPRTEHGQRAAEGGAGVQVTKKRSKKVRAEASNGEEKRDEISNGGAGSLEDKEGADGSGVLMSEKTRKNQKTKKLKDMGAAAGLGNGHMDTAEGEEEKSAEKAVERERKKKKVPVQESRTGMGAGEEGEDGNKGITGVEEAQEGNGEKKQLKKKNAGVTGPRGGEKEKRGTKGVMKGEKKREKGKAQRGEEDVAGSVQEEEEERMKKNKKRRKAQTGEEDVAGSVQEEEEERMKKNKKKRKAQPGEEDMAGSVQEEERMKKNKKKRKAQPGEEDVAGSVQEEEEERMKKNKKKRKAQPGEEDMAGSVQEEEEERMKKNKKKRKPQAGEKDVAASVPEEERMKKNKKKKKAQAGEEGVAVGVQEEEEERVKKRKAQAGEENVAVSVLEEEEERMKNKKKRKAQAKGGDTAVVIQETMKEPNEKERVHSGSGKGQSGSREIAPSKGRRKKSEGGQEAKTSSEGSAVMEDQEGGVLYRKQKKKRRKSDGDKVACEDSVRTEQGEAALTLQSRTKQREGTAAEEMDVVFLSEKMGNKDEVTIDQVRRQALQNEIDKVSCPQDTQMLGQWGTAHFENASQQQKFLRLMGGFKKGNKPIGCEQGRANMALGKEGQQRLQQDLLVEFERAQSRRMDFQNKGGGLGFSPQSNKKFFIDVNASRSVRFDD